MGGEEERTGTSSFTYIDSSSPKLLSSTETRESSYTSYEDNYSDYRLENITFTYDYSGLRDSEIHGEYDFSTRWGEGTTNYQNSEGDNEIFNIYLKETLDGNNSSSSWEELKVETSESG